MTDPEVWTLGDGTISVTVNAVLSPDDARSLAGELIACAESAEIEARS